MKIILEDGVLDLPEGFSFEIEHHHPFYSDEGTASIPATLPATPNNLTLLSRPESFQRSKRFIREKEALLESGSFRKKCTILIESASDKSISASLALQESEMYAAAQDKKLKDILADIYYGMTKINITTPYEIYTGTHRNNWYLNDVALFPVAADMDPDKGTAFIINNPSSGTIVDSARTVTIGDSKVSVPEGYGVAPYLYLWAAIQYTFEQLGYTVKTNDFKTETYFRHLVLLHDLADVCCETYDLDFLWTFHYSDLVPDITVGEFITWLHDKFGAIVTHDSGVVEILLFSPRSKNVPPDLDLTEYTREGITVTYPEPQGLRLSMETSIERAEPAAESMEDLRILFENCGNAASYDAITGSGLFFVPPLGQYFFSDGNGNISLLGSEAFPYSRKASPAECMEISTADEFVPMVRFNDMYMPYIGQRQHKYIGAGDPAPAQPIKICYAHFSGGVFQGSTNTYGKSGSVISAVSGATSPVRFPSLTPEGLRTWWEVMETCLLNSAPVLEAEMDIPISVVLSTDLTTPKLLKGARVIITDMTFTVGESDIAHAVATLQVLPQYSDLLTSPKIVFGTAYSWKVESTRWLYDGGAYTVISTDGLTDYTEDDAPDYKPGSVGVKVKVRQRWLKYRYYKKIKKWWGTSSTEYTGTHKWEEYFISVSSSS